MKHMSLDGRIPCALRILGPQNWIRTPEPIQVQPPVPLEGSHDAERVTRPTFFADLNPYERWGKSDTSRHPRNVQKLRGAETQVCGYEDGSEKAAPAVRVVDGFHRLEERGFLLLFEAKCWEI